MQDIPPLVQWIVGCIVTALQWLSLRYVSSIATELKETRLAGVEQGKLLAELRTEVDWLKNLNDRRRANYAR